MARQRVQNEKSYNGRKASRFPVSEVLSRGQRLHNMARGAAQTLTQPAYNKSHGSTTNCTNCG